LDNQINAFLTTNKRKRKRKWPAIINGFEGHRRENQQQRRVSPSILEREREREIVVLFEISEIADENLRIAVAFQQSFGWWHLEKLCHVYALVNLEWLL
jgi:hypothetical protein